MESLLDVSAGLIAGTRDIGDHHPLAFGTTARLEEIAPGLAFVESFANSVVLEDDPGLLMVDAGSPLHAAAIQAAVRGWSTRPLHTAIFTHGHVDHVFAIALFEAEGNGPAHVIAHEEIANRFARYDLTNGYNGVINQRQFQLPGPIFPSGFRTPDETYRDEMSMKFGSLDLQLFHDRGETDDGTWVWIPQHRAVCAGDLVIWASPNCGNPQKVQRYCDEWAVALRRMAALEPELLLPGHGLPIAGASVIQQVLLETAEYLEHLFHETIAMMNAGARLDEIVHSVRAPDHLALRPWLQPVYDEPEFIVRNIWRLYGGWYDGNPAHLKPPRDAELASELAALAGGAERLAERALELLEGGQERLATSLIEMASQASKASTSPVVVSARATIFRERANRERSTMARGVYSWAERESEVAKVESA